ncbi:hypothetical protein PIB30_091233 [Stylosanthes scabra]|uniref:Uncharacterized protein n=1 Tax=Stylosanthes scabra TaxID=79078 RepID=A0ABU6QUV1_9FABA|nr:hypothetical protein [Stylosanthes scabra]
MYSFMQNMQAGSTTASSAGMPSLMPPPPLQHGPESATDQPQPDGDRSLTMTQTIFDSFSIVFLISTAWPLVQLDSDGLAVDNGVGTNQISCSGVFNEGGASRIHASTWKVPSALAPPNQQ